MCKGLQKWRVAMLNTWISILVWLAKMFLFAEILDNFNIMAIDYAFT